MTVHRTSRMKLNNIEAKEEALTMSIIVCFSKLITATDSCRMYCWSSSIDLDWRKSSSCTIKPFEMDLKTHRSVGQSVSHKTSIGTKSYQYIKKQMMRHFFILSFFIASCFAVREMPAGSGIIGQTRNLILTEQELRFAGHTLRSVLSGNVNGYVSRQLFVTWNQKKAEEKNVNFNSSPATCWRTSKSQIQWHIHYNRKWRSLRRFRYPNSRRSSDNEPQRAEWWTQQCGIC